MKLLHKIDPGVRYPRGYGLFYYNHEEDRAYCLPIPLNLIARFARELYYRLAVGWRAGKFPTCSTCVHLRESWDGDNRFSTTLRPGIEVCKELSIGDEVAGVSLDGDLEIYDPESFGCSLWKRK